MIISKIKRRVVSILKKHIGVRVPVLVPVINGCLLENRTILITGGGSGIGYAIADACLRNGAHVIICGRNIDKLRIAESELASKYGNRIQSIQLDIVHTETLASSLETAIELSPMKRIDTLINNAGFSGGGVFGNTDVESFMKVMETNLKGTYFLSEKIFNYFKKQKIQGNILNISSSSAVRPANNPYAISKWGESGFTKGVAKQLIKYGIVVNAVAPGPTAAGMMAHVASGDINRESSPVGRYITAEEIANVAIFLISDMGRMIVGETIYVTGGMGTLTFDDVLY